MKNQRLVEALSDIDNNCSTIEQRRAFRHLCESLDDSNLVFHAINTLFTDSDHVTDFYDLDLDEVSADYDRYFDNLSDSIKDIYKKETGNMLSTSQLRDAKKDKSIIDYITDCKKAIDELCNVIEEYMDDVECGSDAANEEDANVFFDRLKKNHKFINTLSDKQLETNFNLVDITFIIYSTELEEYGEKYESN